MDVKWCGFDYGQCIMQPGSLRTPFIFGEICKTLGQPELIADKMRKYRVLKEKYGTYGRIKEGHRDEIHRYVMDDVPEAVDLYDELELTVPEIGDGLEDALSYLQGEGIDLWVVSEMKKTLGAVGTDMVSRFLKTRGLVKYFRHLATPQGKIDLTDDSIDRRYQGHTKAEGTLYDVLAEELGERGIKPDEAVMVGDKPGTDIDPAHQRGFLTIQYTGFIDLGPSQADLVIRSFSELKTILRKKED